MGRSSLVRTDIVCFSSFSLVISSFFEIMLFLLLQLSHSDCVIVCGSSAQRRVSNEEAFVLIECFGKN